MAFLDLPRYAAWEHREARNGFEVVFLGSGAGGHRLAGHTVAVEAGAAWAVDYDIGLGPDWITRRARVTGRSASDTHVLTLQSDGRGRWLIDGRPAPHLDGCLDADLESSAL